MCKYVFNCIRSYLVHLDFYIFLVIIIIIITHSEQYNYSWYPYSIYLYCSILYLPHHTIFRIENRNNVFAFIARKIKTRWQLKRNDNNNNKNIQSAVKRESSYYINADYIKSSSSAVRCWRMGINDSQRIYSHAAVIYWWMNIAAHT